MKFDYMERNLSVWNLLGRIENSVHNVELKHIDEKEAIRQIKENIEEFDTKYYDIKERG